MSSREIYKGLRASLSFYAFPRFRSLRTVPSVILYGGVLFLREREREAGGGPKASRAVGLQGS